MSASHARDHDHGHDHGHGEDLAYHATGKGYLAGFILSVLLTAIPFWLVMYGSLPARLTSLVIVGFAAVQVLVHMVFFLHLNAKAEGGWSLLAMVFTAIIVLIMLAGSIWVMFHLNTNMMPMMDAETMRHMP